MNLENLQVVVIDCPYNSFSSELTQKLFGKFINMKLTGFLKEYGHGVMPLSSYDFIGTLIMLCEKNGEELDPVFCFKSSTLERVEYFGLPFEINGLLSSSGAGLHLKVIAEIVEKAKAGGRSIGYNSSWTISPNWRHQPDLKSLAKDLSVALFTHYYQSRNIDEILIGGVMKYKVDQIQAFLGFEYLELDGERLPPVETWFVRNEKTILMHLKRFSSEAQTIADRYVELWNNRLEIVANSHQNEKVAA